MENAVPQHAYTILVPVANPETARGLLELGVAMAHPREGRVIALIVSMSDADKEAEAVEAIEPIVLDMEAEEKPVELITTNASSVSRGILDAVREEGADLVIVGLNKPTHGQVVIGTISESVASTAPCGVLIYRPGLSPEFSRIVIPTDGSEDSRIAVRVSIMLSEYYDVPAEAMYVQSGERAYWEGRGRIEASMQDIKGQERIKRTVVTAADPADGILSRVNEDDLLVVGFSGRSEWQRWLYGDFSLPLLNRSPGPVILTSRAPEKQALAGFTERFVNWLRPTLTQVEQDDLVRQASQNASASLDFTVLMMIAAVLASFGLLLNSGAVIIGAMLVAPLMSPLISFSTGVTTGRLGLMRRSIITVLQGVILALVVSFVIGLIGPSDIVTSEMAGRGNPTIIDLGVALASGLIGAYATARKDIPAALAGVAIAAALVPPICTIGLGLSISNFGLARGATLLFVTNIISIILAAWGIFFWLGMRPRVIDTSRARPFASAALVGSFVLVIVLLVAGNVDPNRFEVGVERVLRESFEPFSEASLVDFEIQRDDPLLVVAIVRVSSLILEEGGLRETFRDQVQSAQQALADQLNQPVELDVVMQPVMHIADTGKILTDRLTLLMKPAELVNLDYNFDNDGQMHVLATVRPAPGMSEDAVRELATEAARLLESSLLVPVDLQLQFESGDATPEATAEPAAG
ncbi:MAG: DUF389 domain-containing protein [Anaerolineae bacterium]|nr:DUF389 domain-containing protein [Anaerolineae bacterium]